MGPAEARLGGLCLRGGCGRTHVRRRAPCGFWPTPPGATAGAARRGRLARGSGLARALSRLRPQGVRERRRERLARPQGGSGDGAGAAARVPGSDFGAAREGGAGPVSRLICRRARGPCGDTSVTGGATSERCPKPTCPTGASSARKGGVHALARVARVPRDGRPADGPRVPESDFGAVRENVRGRS